VRNPTKEPQKINSHISLELKYSVQFSRVSALIPTNVSIKSSVFWDIMPCSPFKVDRRFGGICHFHLHCQRKNEARNQREAGSKRAATSKRLFTLNGIPGVIFQKIELFINTAVRTTNHKNTGTSLFIQGT
jgi:hypothetical protein